MKIEVKLSRRKRDWWKGEGIGDIYSVYNMH